MAKPIIPATELISTIRSDDCDTDVSTFSDVEMDNNAEMQNHNRLSRVSKMYDINGDGVLDEAERAMRELDETGRGYLTNEKVYELMSE
jgi:Ca2+-binding EF-hand superfamily protein